jgi:hypothetical protein
VENFLKYQTVARNIVKKLKENIEKTISKGESPDLYWNLENAIIQAMRDVEADTARATKEEVLKLIKEFDEDNGTIAN